MKKVMNIVNFVRGIEPRYEMDLYTPVKEQIRCNKEYGIPNTFLLQYDAMVRPDFQELFLQEKDEKMELGVWFENCRELIERIGLQWNGRFDWDWHVNVGFLEGYTPEQREQIIDTVFETFYNLFGFYPQVAGSWVLDSHSMQYMCQKYGMKAFCNCREQYAVDAYTLWGGYSSGGYYPSKNNMLCPAQTPENKIPAPLFRMLGADPIYNYDESKYDHTPGGLVRTMEPAWKPGQDPHIIDWYLDTYYRTPCLTHCQVTTGQENSFGWQTFGDGYRMQIEKIVRMADRGELVIEKLGDTGVWYQNTFPLSAPTAQVALQDWNANGAKTVWYNCKNYRLNLFLYRNKLILRDLTKYDDRYTERYLKERCADYLAVYDNLPVVDSRIWSREDMPCEIGFGKPVKDLAVTEKDSKTLVVTVFFEDGKEGTIILSEREIAFSFCDEMYYMPGVPDGETKLTVALNGIYGMHNHFTYEIPVKGFIRKKHNRYMLMPEENVFALCMDVRA